MRLNYTVVMFAILSSVCWAEQAPRLSMAHATEIATKAYPGKIESSELEQEKGRSVYSFDIRRAGESDIHEILVDANTGDIVSQSVETAADQAAEKKADAKKPSSDSSYSVVDRMTLPSDGGWDYLTIDPAARLLYITHATQVQLFDLNQKKIVGVIANTPGVHGVALAPTLNRGFISNGKENTVTVFDLKSRAELARVPVEGQNPDAIVFDPASGNVFAFNGKSGDASVIDPQTSKVVAHIALGGKPEFAVADGQGMLYDALEDQSQIVAINTKELKVKARWPVAPCEEPGPITMDVTHRRLFAGCGNHLMAVLDADRGTVLTTLPIGDHTDDMAFDAEQRLIFNSNGDGTLTVMHQDDPDHYHVVANVQTAKGARTMALDSKTHRVYLVTAQFGPAPAATAEQPHPRASIIPGTFQLLTVAPND